MDTEEMKTTERQYREPPNETFGEKRWHKLTEVLRAESKTHKLKSKRKGEMNDEAGRNGGRESCLKM